MSNEGIAGRQCNGIGVLERGGGGEGIQSNLSRISRPCKSSTDFENTWKSPGILSPPKGRTLLGALKKI